MEIESPAPLTFVIGDVHGCAALLELVLEKIEEISANAGIEPQVIFVGDLVDRGLETRRTLDLVIRTLRWWPTSIVVRGNHDDMLLSALSDDGVSARTKHWYDNCGGWDTCGSYATDGDLEAARYTLRKRYISHIHLLSDTPYVARSGSLVICHAGINGYLPLGEQSPHDLMWISDGFLDRVDGKMPAVVHGHTIMGDLPVVTENRISIDTGAYESGRLTCFMIDRRNRTTRFIQTQDNEVVQVDPVFHDRGRGSVLDRKNFFT